MPETGGFDGVFDELCEGLAERGWAATERLFSVDEARALALEGRAAWQAGGFRQAAVGRGPARRVRAEVRRDHVLWLDPAAPTPAQRAYLERMEALRQHLNRSLFLGLFELESHLAVFPPGAFYRPHLDRLRGSEHRLLTAILYLNEGWTADDGGALRLWLETSPAETSGPPVGSATLEIAPRAGTFVTFLSGDLWHEVLPATRERLSLTGWLCARR